MIEVSVSKKKSKIMSVNSGATRSVNIDRNPLEHIEDFTYLGSVISMNNIVQKGMASTPG